MSRFMLNSKALAQLDISISYSIVSFISLFFEFCDSPSNLSVFIGQAVTMTQMSSSLLPQTFSKFLN